VLPLVEVFIYALQLWYLFSSAKGGLRQKKTRRKVRVFF
jgi:hypothetical protein